MQDLSSNDQDFLLVLAVCLLVLDTLRLLQSLPSKAVSAQLHGTLPALQHITSSSQSVMAICSSRIRCIANCGSNGNVHHTDPYPL